MARGWFGSKEAHRAAALKGWITRRKNRKVIQENMSLEQRKAAYREKHKAEREAREANYYHKLTAEEEAKANKEKQRREYIRTPKGWSETFAISKTPDNPEARRKWYQERAAAAPVTLMLKYTDGREFDLPFATKKEAEKEMRSASVQAYRARLSGVTYERTKNYGWKKKG